MRINKTKNAARNLVFGLIQKTVNMVLPFLSRTVMIRTLGVNYLGLNSLFSSILQVLNLAELGVGSAMIFSMYRPLAEDDQDTVCALMRLYRICYWIIGTFILAAGLVLIPFLPRLIKKDLPDDVSLIGLYLLNLCSTVLSYWLFAYKNSLLYACQRNDVIDKTSTAVICAQQGVQILVLYVFRNYYYYLMIVLSAQILKNLINAAIVSRMFPQYEAKGTLPREAIRKICRRVRDLFTVKIGNTVIHSVDFLVISSCLGLNSLAMYNNYYYVVNAVITLVYLIFTACQAGIGHSLITESLEKNYSDFKTMTFLVNWISGFCFCSLAALLQPFMKIWVGEPLMFDNRVACLFCIYFYLYILCGLFSTYKDSAGIWHEDRVRPLVGAAANLALNLSFVGRYGIYAILLSTVISYLLVNIPWLIHTVFHSLFHRSPKEYLLLLIKEIFATTAMGVFVSWFSIRAFPETIPGFLCRFFCCAALFHLLFVIRFRNTEEFRNCLCILKRMRHWKTHER